MKSVPFRTSLAENIFRFRYAQGSNDHWEALSRRCVEDVCGRRWGTEPMQLLSNEEQKQLTEYISQMKFIPGGRYLYYAGRKKHFYNNCFSKDTQVLTKNGWRSLKFLEGKDIQVLSPVDGKWKKATVKKFGRQKLQEITFLPFRGKSDVEYKVKATRTHHWPLLDGGDTYDLRVGDLVPANKFGLYNSLGFIHGVIFGDGTKECVSKKGIYTFKLRCCCEHTKEKLEYLIEKSKEYDLHPTVHYPKSANGDPVLRIRSIKEFKEIPYEESAEYIAGFLKGWVLADGSKAKNKQLASINKEGIEFFNKNLPFCGWVSSGKLLVANRDTNFKKESTLFYQSYTSGEKWAGFKVNSIKELGFDDVYCVVEPEYNRFIIDYGIDTFNCSVLIGEEDTREEWARLANAATLWLMSGGGIGIDYSVFRPNGRILESSGGISSGPVPLMKMINEVARNVIQGGSRRSACWAGLNHQHEDIPDFIKTKDWSEEVKRLKANDFNFPATLDMTNISIGWDTDFIEGVEAGEIPDLWLESCKRMMETGEPGHTYNFFEREFEVGRNACGEVSSEFDSDCCNLGSVNLSRIESIEELKEVCYLGAKFLVCGTIRAELPYQKCYEIRNKTRRIGLGLMGIHEWLLSHNYGYEVNEELSSWLDNYVEYSEKGANDHCDRFYLRRPVAYRSIAPNGTTGIVTSTTTGIEPIFALAYKRRYLMNGSRWQYEYVVDATSEYIKQTYDLEPESIETAYSLAKEPEKRIKFQYDMQKYVDQGIASTINLPAWGTEYNNEDKVKEFSDILLKYCPGLRGITCYPDGSRGGQPLTEVPYEEAKQNENMVFDENEEKCHGSICSL